MGHAIKRSAESARGDGLLLGFFSGAALEGVITGPGEKFHLHWASRDFARAGHVDAYGVGAEAELLLPPAVLLNGLANHVDRRDVGEAEVLKRLGGERAAAAREAAQGHRLVHVAPVGS